MTAAHAGPFFVAALLEHQAEAILDEAKRARESTMAGEDDLRGLLDVVLQCLAGRDLAPIRTHAAAVADAAYEAGTGLDGPLAGYHALAEGVWRRIVETASPEDLADAIGLAATVLCTGEDRLARTYLGRAGGRPVPSLDLRALLRGGT